MAQPITLFKVVRWSKPFLVAALVPLFSQLTPSTAWAQESPSSTAQGGALPEAPGPPQITDKVDSQTSTGSITGTVLDTNLEVMQDVGVTLAGGAGFARTVESGFNGEFAFRGLPPDVYKSP